MLKSSVRAVAVASRHLARNINVTRPLCVSTGFRAYSAPAYSYPKSLLHHPETKITTFENGMRVATETTSDQTATVGVFIDAGSRYETDFNNGVAHFLEHMAFKGTPKRTQMSLEKEIEDMGGSLNAYTSREQTWYYARVFKDDVGKAVDILADILLNSKYEQSQIDAECGVILREMQDIEEKKDETIFDHLHATAFQGTALGRTILGPEERVKAMSREDLKSFVKKHYLASRMVIAAAGGVDHKELCSQVKNAFSGMDTTWEVPELPQCPFTGSDVRLRDDTMPLAHIALAVEGCSWSSPDYFPLLVANAIIGSWDRSYGSGRNMQSQLAQNIAKHDAVHSFMSFNSCYLDTGLWGVYLTSPAMKTDDAVFMVQTEWMRLCTTVSEAEVRRAKNQLKTNIFAQLDNTSAIAEDIGRQLVLYGRRMTPAEIDARIEAVDAKTIHEVCSKYIWDQDLAMACMGPIEAVPDYNRLRFAMTWNRY